MLRSPKRQPIDPNELNIGTRLYQKGVKRQEEKERFCKNEKERMNNKIDEKLIFKP